MDTTAGDTANETPTADQSCVVDSAKRRALKHGEVSISSIHITSENRESTLPNVLSPTEMPKRQGSHAEVRQRQDEIFQSAEG
jgi:hypothetical protein